MASCAPPPFLRPGFLRLEYYHTSKGIQHSARCGIAQGIDIGDRAAMLAKADEWASWYARCLTNLFQVTGYSVLDPDGRSLYTGALTTTVVGSHTTAANTVDSASNTVTFTGKGIPGVVTQCSGEIRVVMYIGGALEFASGQKFLAAGTDSRFDDHAGFLVTDAVLWADFYGQAGDLRGLYPIQTNAYRQKRSGA